MLQPPFRVLLIEDNPGDAELVKAALADAGGAAFQVFCAEALLPAEQEQGVFTISNLGAFGIDAFDAVLNPPQAAILAVGRIKEQAMVEKGMVVPAAMLTLSLSVDHRVLDGAKGARFLGDLAELLETPALSME